MESQQLAFFALSCREPNHSAAARRLGVAPSTLSTNLRLLETELGLSLFSRAPGGHKPNPYVRRIFQDVEAVLRRLEVAETLAAAPVHRPTPDLVVKTSFEFVLGRVSNAASVAARAVHQRHKGILTRIGFSSQRFSGRSGGENRRHSTMPMSCSPTSGGQRWSNRSRCLSTGGSR